MGGGGCNHNRNHMFSNGGREHGLYERWEFLACCPEVVFHPGSKRPPLARLGAPPLSKVAEWSQTLRWWRPLGRCLTGHVLMGRPTVSDPHLRVSACILLFHCLEGPKNTSWEAVNVRGTLVEFRLRLGQWYPNSGMHTASGTRSALWWSAVKFCCKKVKYGLLSLGI